MYRIKKALRLLLPAALIAAGFGPAAPALAGTPSPAGGVRTITGTFADGAKYLIEVPAKWNGTLWLYSHGYVVPGANNPAMDVGDPLTRVWMLNHGFALAGSSYAATGWALQQALPDQIQTLNTFDKKVGTPTRTIAWGHSLGGMITAGLIQRYPNRFNAALPMCGVLSGGVATWNTALDAAFAFQQLIDPSVSIVNITDPGANVNEAEAAAAAAQNTPQGRARLALVSALADTPGWFTPLSPEPAPTDYVSQEDNQYLWGSQVTFPFVFALRADLEARAGGNPSWNTGVNYGTDLLKSADFQEVVALYQAAGLNLYRDIAKLQRTPRIAANPTARRWLVNNITYNGKINIPVLTLHTIGDGLVVPENEQAYKANVAANGGSALLRQLFVARAGHCAFTPAETITAAKALLQRLDTGQWGSGLASAATLNKRATALGPTYNVFSLNGQVVPAAPAFQRFSPPPYLRPFSMP